MITLNVILSYHLILNVQSYIVLYSVHYIYKLSTLTSLPTQVGMNHLILYFHQNVSPFSVTCYFEEKKLPFAKMNELKKEIKVEV